MLYAHQPAAARFAVNVAAPLSPKSTPLIFDVRAIFRDGHVDALFIAAAGKRLDAFFVADGARFHLRKRIEGADLLNAFIVPPREFLNRAVRIVG